VACWNPSEKDFYLGMTLRYPYEVREENAYFDEIPIGWFLAAS
jgi:non-homologous end joining protein Ku